MTEDKSAKCLSDLMREVYLRFHRRVRPSEYRPSRESLAVLDHLDRSGPLTVMEAARHFERSQSAMSEILDRLESRGLLERIEDERDRRRKLVWLTSHGLVVMERAFAVYSQRLLEEAITQMNSEETEALFAGLRGLLATPLSAKGWDDE